MPKRTKRHRTTPPSEQFGLWGSVIGLCLGMFVGLAAEMVGGISMMKMAAGGFGGLAVGVLVDGILYLIRIWNTKASKTKTDAKK